jgi:hypothetical protein
MSLNTATMKKTMLYLYRSLLRAHQKCLPTQMKQLGDAYVKSEFKLHLQKTVKPEQMQAFLSEWQIYLKQIETTARAVEQQAVTQGSPTKHGSSSPTKPKLFRFGADLPSDVSLSNEQKVQLEKLKEEASSFKV